MEKLYPSNYNFTITDYYFRKYQWVWTYSFLFYLPICQILQGFYNPKNRNLYKNIGFIWNGVNSQSGDNVKILQGEETCYTGRGQSSLSFNTGLTFKTEQDVSLFTINPVNYFNDDFETMSSLISTSFFDNPIPLAIKARSANKEILIKAGTPLATIIPISLTGLNNSCIEINEYQDPDNRRNQKNQSYGEASQKINQNGEWTDWYRNAVDENEESRGNHEVKILKLAVTDNTIKEQIE
jgi:hypothetical protein